MKKDRRQFLKNTTLATLAIGVSPLVSKASPSVDSGEDPMGGGCDVLTED